MKPLTRRGHGPGLIIITPDSTDPLAIVEGVPSFLIKWAEEGYTVVEIQASAVSGGAADLLKAAVDALKSCDSCTPADKIGLICKSSLSSNESVCG